MAVPPDEIDHVYSIFINASPERIWRAITDGDETVQYYYGTRVDSDWQLGSHIRYDYPDGTVAADGEVIGIDPPKRLEMSSWRAGIPSSRPRARSARSGSSSRRTAQTKLTVTTIGLKTGSRMAEEFGNGIVYIVSGLKSHVEGGRGGGLRRLTASPLALAWRPPRDLRGGRTSTGRLSPVTPRLAGRAATPGSPRPLLLLLPTRHPVRRRGAHARLGLRSEPGRHRPVPREGARARGGPAALSRLPARVPAARARPDGRPLSSLWPFGPGHGRPSTRGCSRAGGRPARGARRSCRRGSSACGATPARDGCADRAVAAELRRVALRLFVLSSGASLALTWRFDLFPALLAIVALWAALEQPAGRSPASRSRSGSWRSSSRSSSCPRSRSRGSCRSTGSRLVRYGRHAVVTVIVGLRRSWRSPARDAFAFLRYQAERGLQIESVGGGLVLLGGWSPASPIGLSFAVQRLGGRAAPLARRVLAALPVATVVGFGRSAVLGWRRIRREVRVGGAGRAGDDRPCSRRRRCSCCSRRARSSRSSTSCGSCRSPRCCRAAVLARGGGRRADDADPPGAVQGARRAGGAADPRPEPAQRAARGAAACWDCGGREVARPAGLEPTTFRSAT